MMKTLAIVMPSYRESASLEKLIPLLLEAGKEQEFSPQLVIVNDLGYSDSELQALQQKYNFDLVNAPHNMGSQDAIVHGVEYVSKNSKADYVLVMDSDGQDDPNAIGDLLQAAQLGNVIAVAQRAGKRPEGLFFHLFYRLYQWIFKFLTAVQVDFGNYSVFSHSLAKQIAASPHFKMTFSLCLPKIAPLVRIPVPRLERIDGKSRVGYSGLLNHAIRSILPYLQQIATRVAAISVMIGFIGIGLMGLLAYLKFFVPEAVVSNWVTIISIGVILFSMQLLTICILLFLGASLYRSICNISR